MLNNNLVKKNLKEFGNYQWITFDIGYPTDMKESPDLFLRNKQYFSEFYNMFVNATPLRVLIKESSKVSPFQIHRNKILFSFEKLKEVPDIELPTFTFAHIIAPHPPFVFDRDGNLPPQNKEFSLGLDLTQDISTNRKQYIDQLIYINQEALKTIKSIIKKSDNPPIIILQADHGFPETFTKDQDKKLETRMSILNADYFPEYDYDQLYNSITPINSFRLIFDHYFGTNYGFLEDKSYYSDYERPYSFQEVR